jgi:succinate dehydrogenase/fumarate reductase flavoprotein subunit
MDIVDKFDDIIIGAGGAGLTTAIFLAKSSRKVVVISKSLPYLSHTSAAQGGINANFGNQLEDDWKWHAYDTIRGSDWLADQDAVEILCSKANSAVNFLSEIGVNFDKDSSNKILQKKYGGQTTYYGKGDLALRACSVRDRTGAAMIESLYKEAIKNGVIFINYNLVIDLIIENNNYVGCTSYDITSGKISILQSANLVIATGGFSCIYQENTASKTLTGDGLYLLSKKSYALKDMEFIQFHPTSMKGTGILVSETARSIGGYLINDSHTRFMSKYAPKYLELAPRDIVSKAISQELLKSNNIYLDLSHVGPDQIDSKLGYVAQACRKFINKDIKNELIPIAPAAHYTMGGIPTNSSCAVLDIKNNCIIEGLYAVGEAACLSVHGANRLGCNSLLDIVVFGIECAKSISQSKRERHNTVIREDYLNNTFTPESDKNTNQKKLEVQKICTEYLSITKNEADIIHAIDKLNSIKIPDKLPKPISSWDIDFINSFELHSMLLCAKHVAHSSLSRKESRGSHYRSDFSERDDKNYQKHSYSINLGDKFEVFFAEVRTNTQNIDFFPPERRNY